MFLFLVTLCSMVMVTPSVLLGKSYLSNNPFSSPLTLDSITSYDTPPKPSENSLTLSFKKPQNKEERKALEKELKQLVGKRAAKELNEKELRTVVQIYKALEKYDKVLFYLQELELKTKDARVIESITLEKADIYFEQGKLEKAEKQFALYQELYPGSKHTEYVLYKRILCLFYQRLDVDQDQKRTKEILKLAQPALEKKAIKAYKDEVQSIVKYCNLMLYKHELDIYNFYYKKKNYKAANQRLAFLRKDFLQDLPELEPEIIHIECTLAKAEGKKDLYQQRLAYLEKQYPQHYQSYYLAHGSHHKKRKPYVEIL